MSNDDDVTRAINDLVGAVTAGWEQIKSTVSAAVVDAAEQLKEAVAAQTESPLPTITFTVQHCVANYPHRAHTYDGFYCDGKMIVS